ncbi:MAG: hypothetical protein ACK4UN_15565, partial [Limisphaerales bacterium]
TFTRYRTWLDKRGSFHLPEGSGAIEDEPAQVAPESLPKPAAPLVAAKTKPTKVADAPSSGRIEIEPVEEFEKILKKP